MSRRAFTVEEANALIPALEEALVRVERHRADLLRLQEKMQILDVLWGGKLLDPGNPDYAEASGYRMTILANIRAIERVVQEEMVAPGLRLPAGGLEHGLVDFPTTWDGRWVYLCWRRGERVIGAWHEVDAGFAGREPITAEQERRMGREDDPAALDDSMLDF